MTKPAPFEGAAVPESGGPVDWPWVQRMSLDALEGLVEHELANPELSLRYVTDQPLALPEGRLNLLYARTSTCAPRGGWDGLAFCLVDADAKGTRNPRRAPARLKYEPQARRLVFEVTPQIRAALVPATHVYVAYGDDTSLELLRRLRPALAEATRAPRLIGLWSGAPLTKPRAVKGLNEEQRQALAAMTSVGGALVWGPPGTGKTTVIAEAVARALKDGRSVLIASHTHVAVDNVVEGVAEKVTKAGIVVRVGDREKLSEKVVGHEWLMLEKAAAFMTNRAERLEEITDQIKIVREDPRRGELDSAADRLAGVDLGAVERAVEAREAIVEADRLDGEAAILSDTIEALKGEADDAAARIAEARPEAQAVHRLREDANRAARGEDAAAQTLGHLEQGLASLHKAFDRANSDWATAAAASEGGTFWTRFVARRKANSASNRSVRFQEQITAVSEQTEQARSHANHAHAAHAEAAARFRGAEAAAELLRRLEQGLAQLRPKIAENAGVLEQNRLQARRHRDAAAAAPGFEDVLAEAEEAGTLGLVDEWRRLMGIVDELDEKERQLEQDKELLDQEYEGTKRRLLAQAPVIACTLARLVGGEELAKRRFDIVIVDEAASAQIPWLVNAGAKADRTLAFVGDFLQNAPIAPDEDATTEKQRSLSRWQRDDVFALLGVKDRTTAEAHPRCAALRTQYRFPRMIADLVNEFCYDGFLDTGGQKEPRPPHIVFVDTHGHRGADLRPTDPSWTHPLGFELLRALYAHEAARGVKKIGLVCPYGPQAAKAARIARDNGMRIECGTAHRFQGRQYDTVVFDLMQDNQERWAGAADLKGTRRQVSAAKLLNVGVTRAKSTLYLIGDWPFVQRSSKPGMRAIAGLDGREGFVLLTAAEVLDGSGLATLHG